MPEIRKLDPHVADLIAAGEVVERPASVVKELMENAVDAGATSLTVEIRGGGMALLRVTDNGCGMAPEDAETAFLRHATSKLRDEEGLEAIGTLGFRGEALAAIAAVSRVELLTRRRGDDEGTRLTLEGGQVREHTPTGCPEGTEIAVRELFYNTPARLKFMKNDRAEGQASAAAAARVAMSHPEISVRLLRDGKEEFQTPGDGRLDSCVYTLLGRECAGSLLSAEADDGELAVRGFVSTPAGCGGNRSRQFFFCNGRYIKSKLLQAAVEQAYRNALLPGRYPVCVLYLTISAAAVDVNVHPAKTEVRFVREKQVFDGVYYAALAALAAEEGSAQIPLSASTRRVLEAADSRQPEARPAVQEGNSTPRASAKPAPGAYKTMTADSYRNLYGGSRADSGRRTGGGDASDRTPRLRESESAPYQTSFRLSDSALERPVSRASSASGEIAAPEAAAPVRIPAPAVPDAPEADAAPEFRVVGEALDTYIVVEKGDTLLLIDKHAAHERILFDALRASPRDDAPQLLLIPEQVRVGAEDTELLEENEALLAEYGFDISPFGEDCVAVRQIPSYLARDGAQDAVFGLCTVLRRGGSPQDIRDGLLHTMACKGAVKAGSQSPPDELRALAARVVSGEVKYCPHGRPVAMELTKAALDRGFRRT